MEIASSPPQSSPLKHVQTASQIKVFEDMPTSPSVSDSDNSIDVLEDMASFPEPVKRLRPTGPTQRILQRSFGGFESVSRGRRWNDHCADWQADTVNFVSPPTDVHAFTGTALPFCTASCNANSMVAIGEEEGCIRLIDSSRSADFSTPHVTFRPHHNAVMDMTFSSDDYMLATASGDQTSRIIDMHTQQTICILSGHTSSVKQIRFQPNDDNMLTTSSRDGSVQIWDMRCGGRGTVASLRTAFARNVDNGENEPTVRYSKHRLDVGSAHRSSGKTHLYILKIFAELSLSAPPPGNEGLSVTSIQHLPNRHYLLTTSEVNSSIKVWDLRNAGRRWGAAQLPVSSSSVPEHHNRTRNFGISSMALSTDGARLYAACRDGAVYAYSTNHLLLGKSSELPSQTTRSKAAKSLIDAVGPLYSFRHPSLRVGSFYIKAAIRKAKNDKSEMLAIGSSDHCAVLFPTDERKLPQRDCTSIGNEEKEETLPSLPSLAFLKPRTQSDVPIYHQGTPLIRGHNKEVTSLTWTYDGDLVTISDNFAARCWRENAEGARELRACGEGGGKRWKSGWADVELSWDKDEE
jgi:WD40 repeat protein